jgi:hypothetical protein
MATHSAICRQREAHHRDLASQATLPNVRKIALAAAAAWHEQALEADRQESGSSTQLSDEDAAIALEFALEADDPSDGSIYDRSDNAPSRSGGNRSFDGKGL